MKNIPVKISDKVEVEIEKIVFGGEGLAFYEGYAIFVPYGVTGDIVEVEVISVKKSYGRALIQKIIKKSEDRISDEFTFEGLRGCDFSMINYEKQLVYKKEMVYEILRNLDFPYENLMETIGSEDPYNYRNKVIEPFGKKDGKIITGYYKKKSHELFLVEEDLLKSEVAKKAIDKTLEILNEENEISVYNEIEHTGALRHVMVRNNSKGEAMVVLVVNTKKKRDIERVKGLLLKVQKDIGEIVSTYISINTQRTNFALGRDLIHVDGKKVLKEKLCGLDFTISPLSFFQINIDQTKKLYDLILKLYKDQVDFSKKVVVDGYSGTGTIGMLVSKVAKKVYGIELVKSATRDAIKGSTLNKLKNIEFINGDMSKKLEDLIRDGRKIDSIIFDPPRKGIDRKTLEKVGEIAIKEFIYVSCNPSTFGRDAKILKGLGYNLEKVYPVDMFPNTAHIEVVGVFKR